jgi:hypothetical protein
MYCHVYRWQPDKTAEYTAASCRSHGHNSDLVTGYLQMTEGARLAAQSFGVDGMRGCAWLLSQWEGLSKSTEHQAPKPKFELCKSETSHR